MITKNDVEKHDPYDAFSQHMCTKGSGFNRGESHFPAVSHFDRLARPVHYCNDIKQLTGTKKHDQAYCQNRNIPCWRIRHDFCGIRCDARTDHRRLHRSDRGCGWLKRQHVGRQLGSNPNSDVQLKPAQLELAQRIREILRRSIEKALVDEPRLFHALS